MPISPKVYTWLCGLFASLGSIIFGYDLGVIAGVLAADDFKHVMGPRFDNPSLLGLITSIFVLGCFFGMIPVAYVADFFGRRKTIQFGALIYIFGGALQTGARNMDYMLVGRFFAGFGVGIMSDLAPLYQAEIAHPSIRGRLITLQQFMLGIGAFCASWVTYGCSAGLKGTQAEWRIPLGIQLMPALPLISFILFLPESPRWLAEKGRFDEATAALARLHAHGNTNDDFVLSQMEDIKADITRSKDIGAASWTELFNVPSNFRRLALGYILQFSVQMTGVSAIQYYSTTIFTTMGFDATRVLLFQSINSIIALIGEACCVLWVDSTGRRLPLIVGNVASGLSFVVGSILMARWPGAVDNNAAHYIFIITTWVFNFFFSACIGPLSWAYPAEIYSTRTRAKATALTSSASWISNFFIAEVTPIAFGHIGWKYYLVFAICGHTNALFVWAFFPETTGRRLEEMDALFEDSPLFIPGTQYAKAQDRHAAERELREGTFVPANLTERVGYEQEAGDVKDSAEIVHEEKR
ncbi:general substrate transporter [Dendrothele bispora CBS 962.96]|uniref:General substrate transporter n=1 Tax=Dendrothele bispora (strain CBS 962.96) TaxID=1314807 RepID=A0A4S8LIW7_DENBC|nr:general substrate transporter [Dendrothele bispora CBS 962.96]